MRVTRPGQPSYAGGITFHQVELALDVSGLEDADVVVFGAPMDDYVTNRPGTRFGPRAIRTAFDGGGSEGWHMDLGVDPFAELRIVDHGDAEVAPGDPERSHAAIEAMMARVVATGAVPVVLGGDHSIAYPDIKGFMTSHSPGEVAIVQFDTHADTGLENWGVTRAHGTPFRHLVDEGVIRGDRLIQVGLRGYWPFAKEFAWMRGAGVRWHRMDEVVADGIDTVIARVLDETADASHLFLSVDVDVLDPAFAPGTGTPEPGGMSSRELLRAVRTLAVERGVAGIEIVEVSPPYDHADITALVADRVAMEAISGLALHRSGRGPRPEQP
ncbi:MAG: agmatinase [Actinomycetota bacterium]